MNRHSARDYKRPRRGGLGLDGTRLRDFALGLALGLVVAVLVYLAGHRAAAGAGATVPAGAQGSVAAPDDAPGLANVAPHARGARASQRPAAGVVHDAGAGATTPGDNRSDPLAGGAAASAPAKSADAANNSAASGASAGVGRFDFYQMLPRFEVVIPEHEHGSRPPPSAQVDSPGTYFLQVGSYRDPSVAERVRAEVARLGIAATVQRIAVDNDVWHRVRVGPIRDLVLLNRLRRQLQSSNLDSLVIRVED